MSGSRSTNAPKLKWRGRCNNSTKMSSFCPLSDAAAIKSALAAAPSFRRAKVADGLYRIDDLKPFRALTHGITHVKTLRRPEEFRDRRAKSDEEFRWRFEEVAARHLRGFDLAANGMCVAGGSVACCLMRDPKKDFEIQLFFSGFSDVDVFLVGDQTEEAVRKNIHALGAHLQRQSRNGKLTVYRTVNCITFCGEPIEYSAKLLTSSGEIKVIPSDTIKYYNGNYQDKTGTWSLSPDQFTVQVILRRYSTPGEIIHGFDLGSCAALWDGSKVLLTRMGAIAAEHGANVLDLTIRRPSYERRLARYFERGYDLVLPDLDVEKLIEARGDLRFLHVSLATSSERCPCAVKAYGLTLIDGKPSTEDDGTDDSSPTQAYAPHGSPPYGDFDAIRRENLNWAISGKAGSGPLCAFADFAPSLQIFNIEPELSTPDEFTNKVVRASLPSETNMTYLQRVFGTEGALRMASVAMFQDYKERTDMVKKLCHHRLAEIPKRTIPLRFLTIDENMTQASSAAVSSAEWYGKCLARHD